MKKGQKCSRNEPTCSNIPSEDCETVAAFMWVFPYLCESFHPLFKLDFDLWLQLETQFMYVFIYFLFLINIFFFFTMVYLLLQPDTHDLTRGSASEVLHASVE